MEIFTCEVISVDDKVGGNRIKARVMPYDRTLSDSEIPFAFPAIPKMMHVIPKVGETVFIICDGNAKGQRLYLGPIISQDQYMDKDYFGMGATNLLAGGNNQEPPYVVDNDRGALGAMADKDDIAIYGRKNTDVILKENELHIRSGSRLANEGKISFNREAPSFIKLKYYDEPLTNVNNNNNVSHQKTKSTAIMVADKIVLASPSGDGGVNINNKGDLISDDEFTKMLERIHMLPYGDVLCDFLYMFLKMFKEHTHKYHNMPTSPLEPAHLAFDRKYGSSLKDIENKLLSKDIGIN